MKLYYFQFTRLPQSWYVLLFLTIPFVHYGQSLETSSYGRFSVNVSVGNHGVGFPFQNQFLSFNPVVPDIGLDFRLNKSRKHSLSLGFNTAFIFNEMIGNEMKLGLNVNYRYQHSSGVFGKLGLDIGSIRSTYSREQFRYNSTTSEYENINHPVNSSFSGFRWSLGYDFEPRFGSRYAVFLGHQFYFQTPYFPVQVLPVLPQNIAQIGLNIKLNQLRKASKS